MSKIATKLWPIMSVALRSSLLVAVALVAIMVVLPAALGAVGGQLPIGR